MKKFIAVVFILLFSLSYAQVGEEVRTRIDSTLDFGLDDLSHETEKILAYHADINVLKDGSLRVVETIKVNARGIDIKRGIFRTLPLRRNLNNKSQKVKYTDIDVTKDGKNEPFSRNYSGEFLKLYIGDEDVYLNAGEYTYQISYSTKNQIGFFDKYDELYWNVNGTQWSFPVDKISATVHLPDGTAIIQNACYTGTAGSKETNCSSQVISDREITWNAENLKNYENLTIAVGFNKGIILPPPPPSFLEKYGVGILLGLAFLSLVLLGYNSWKKYGVDPQKPVVYPQFNVPGNISPASLGYIRSEGYESKYLTAALVNLAIKGFIQIEETEKATLGFLGSNSYKITKLKEPDQSLPKEEIALMNSLLGNKTIVSLNGSYKSSVATAVANFQANLRYQHNELISEGNNLGKLVWPSLLVFFTYILGIGISVAIDMDPLSLGVGIFLLIFLTIAFLGVAIGIKNFKASGCIIMLGIYFSIAILLSIAFVTAMSSLEMNYKLCYLFLIFSFGALMFFKYIIKRPSEDKLHQQSLIDGFKMYINAAENEQLKFHNPPQMTPQIFEKYLPYAMVLGVDAIWGKKFDQAMKTSAAEYQQGWYLGSSAMNFSSFGSSLNSSLTRSVQSTATQPSSSSSGSGSSGGGFSGGGGGGGGGGGW